MGLNLAILDVSFEHKHINVRKRKHMSKTIGYRLRQWRIIRHCEEYKNLRF